MPWTRPKSCPFRPPPRERRGPPGASPRDAGRAESLHRLQRQRRPALAEAAAARLSALLCGAARCWRLDRAGSADRPAVRAAADVPAQFDLPGFYRRAGLVVIGPFVPGRPRWRLLPPLAPFTCVV